MQKKGLTNKPVGLIIGDVRSREHTKPCRDLRSAEAHTTKERRYKP